MAITYGTVKKNEFYPTCGKALEDFKKQLDNLLSLLWSHDPNKIIKILDPCAGGCALDIDYGDKVIYDLYDLEPQDEVRQKIKVANFLEYDFGDKHYDICVCNPPFSLKKQFFNKISKLADYTVFISPAVCSFIKDRKVYAFSTHKDYAYDFQTKNQPSIITFSFINKEENLYEIPNFKRISKFSVKLNYKDYDMKLCGQWRCDSRRSRTFPETLRRKFDITEADAFYTTNWKTRTYSGKIGDPRPLNVLIFKSLEDKEKALKLLESVPDTCVIYHAILDYSLREDYYKELTKYVDLDKIKEFNERK